MRIVRVYEPKVPDQLYFLETECAERHIKIGIASHVGARLAAIQGNCPYRVRLIKRIPGSARLERELHKQFAADRLYGEWFKRSPALLDLIASMEGLETVDAPPPQVAIPQQELAGNYFDDLIETWKRASVLG